MDNEDTFVDDPVNITPNNDDNPKPLSKTAQKKLLKAERFAAQKIERRAREKAAKKEKRRERAQKRAAGEEVDEPQAPSRKRARIDSSVTPFNARVVVDLGFDDKMIDKEVISLCSQLAYTYSANRKATRPFSSLLFTSLNGRTFKRLESLSNASYKRWTGTEWWQEGYDRLWALHGKESDEQPGHDTSAQGVMHASAKDKVIYLTADSDEELIELKEGETYIIGGICDHNRYKNLCEDKAKEGGIRSARLPIGRYLSQLPTRKVLTVNQVFDILLEWVESQDWEKAFYTIIPKRKFQGQSPVPGKAESVGTSDKEGEETKELNTSDRGGKPIELPLQALTDDMILLGSDEETTNYGEDGES